MYEYLSLLHPYMGMSIEISLRRKRHFAQVASTYVDEY